MKYILKFQVSHEFFYVSYGKFISVYNFIISYNIPKMLIMSELILWQSCFEKIDKK